MSFNIAFEATLISDILNKRLLIYVELDFSKEFTPGVKDGKITIKLNGERKF